MKEFEIVAYQFLEELNDVEPLDLPGCNTSYFGTSQHALLQAKTLARRLRSQHNILHPYIRVFDAEEDVSFTSSYVVEILGSSAGSQEGKLIVSEFPDKKHSRYDRHILYTD